MKIPAAIFFLLFIFRADSSAAIAIPAGDSNTVIRLIDLCWKSKSRGSYDTALMYASEALVLSKHLGLKKKTAQILHITGIVYKNQGDYPEALKNYLAAMKIWEDLCAEGLADPVSCKKARASSLNNIATINKEQGNIEEALKQHNEALTLRMEIADTVGMSISYNNIANIYSDLGRFTEALRYYELSLEIDKKIGSPKDLSIDYNNIGEIYITMKKYPEALENHLIALGIKEKENDREGMASSYINLGEVYTFMNDRVRARNYIEKGLSLSKEVNNRNDIKAAYRVLFLVDSALGRHQSALQAYKLYILYRDSLVNEENTKKTVQAQMQYAFNKQQAADSIRNAEQVKQEQLKHDQEIAQQRVYTIGGAIGFLLMLVVAGVSFRAYRQKQKANELITEQKILVEEKQKEILDSIYYARRIQRSLLPSERYIEKCLQKIRKE